MKLEHELFFLLLASCFGPVSQIANEADCVVQVPLLWTQKMAT